MAALTVKGGNDQSGENNAGGGWRWKGEESWDGKSNQSSDGITQGDHSLQKVSGTESVHSVSIRECLMGFDY
ncbi:predicted protein [Uncinocarpus reesii 1704]|uniref:Uncharacterized protein n=1 Tax=Uncinocarpus reesii (strain UAMH 1704) TaxID=336963 RepID=C4JG56_UNCRE|nr:uncharacterized protein UREG_02454 [Uncinocarpus reesii 1704]EEP77605.1 predicted protein [Uncinocarpus reesii 1704]